MARVSLDRLIWTRFKQAGLKTRTEENTSCCYALQDKVWVQDPDGNDWEVFVVKGETYPMQWEPTTTGSCVPQVSAEPKAKAGGGCCP